MLSFTDQKLCPLRSLGNQLRRAFILATQLLLLSAGSGYTVVSDEGWMENVTGHRSRHFFLINIHQFTCQIVCTHQNLWHSLLFQSFFGYWMCFILFWGRKVLAINWTHFPLEIHIFLRKTRSYHILCVHIFTVQRFWVMPGLQWAHLHDTRKKQKTNAHKCVSPIKIIWNWAP